MGIFATILILLSVTGNEKKTISIASVMVMHGLAAIFHLVKAYLNRIYSNDLIWQWFPSLLLTFIARKFGAKKLFLFNKRALYKKKLSNNNYELNSTNNRWCLQRGIISF